jgi:hypothetical protein
MKGGGVVVEVVVTPAFTGVAGVAGPGDGGGDTYIIHMCGCGQIIYNRWGVIATFYV